MMKFVVSLVLCAAFANALPTLNATTPPCCQGKCQTAGEEKYWSIASGIFGTKHCGECCMDPSKYNLYHFFEKNLTKSDSDEPCKGFGYTKYDSTVTHGFGPISMTLDLYDLASTNEADATLYKVSGDECGQSTLDAKYASYAEKFAGLKEGTCASVGYTVADGTQTMKVPVIGDITISKFKKATYDLASTNEADATLYKVSGDECGQSTLDAKYASYAEKFAGLKEGTCASVGYTVADGTQTMKVPVIGDITISKFKKAATDTLVLADSSCPGSAAWIHAKTTIKAAFANSCAEVQAEVKARAEGSTSGKWTDPHNGGSYTEPAAAGDVWSLEHKAAKGYIDKVKLTFSDAANGGCNLNACSESQVTSVLDMSTNFCNIHDLYCADAGCHVLGSKLSYTEDVSASSGQHSTADCYKK